jgi:hypothetical protein
MDYSFVFYTRWKLTYVNSTCVPCLFILRFIKYHFNIWLERQDDKCYGIFTFGCCILLCIYPTGSLWLHQSQQSFNTLTRFYFPSLTTCFGPYGPSSGEIYNGLFLIKRIRCTYATWCRDVTCIGNTKSRRRCTAGNISTSGRVRATDPLY